MTVLMGQYDYALDPKGRFNFPARFREEMGEKFVVTSWVEDCLIALPQSRWEALVEQVTAFNMADGRPLAQRMLPNAMEVEPDKQGRILLTAKLRSHAHLSKDVTVVGMGSYAEIWDTEAWEKKESGLDDGSLMQAIRLMNIRV